MTICCPSDAFQWHMFGNRKPREDRLLMVWRIERKKYIFAKYRVGQDKDDEDGNWEYWVTQQGWTYVCDDEDVWHPFSPYKREVVYE